MVVDRKHLFMLLRALPASLLLIWRRYIKHAMAILASVAVLLSAEKSTYPLARRLWRNVIDKTAANQINRIKAP